MQKKIGWCCAVSAAVAVFAINLAADHAARHPESLVGRALISAYHGNVAALHAIAMPLQTVRETGLLAHDALGAIQSQDTNCGTTAQVSRVGDPVPMPKGSCAAEAPARLPGSIVINGSVDTPTIVEQPVDELPPAIEITLPATSDRYPVDPGKRMPYAEEEEASATVDDANPPDCREDPDRDTQYPGCPATDRCPFHEPPKFTAPVNGHDLDTPDGDGPWLPPQRNKGSRFESNLEHDHSSTDAKSSKKYTWLHKLGKKLIDATILHKDVDTMEFRPTDALPFNLGPNPY